MNGIDQDHIGRGLDPAGPGRGLGLNANQTRGQHVILIVARIENGPRIKGLLVVLGLMIPR